jgi:protein FAM50
LSLQVKRNVLVKIQVRKSVYYLVDLSFISLDVDTSFLPDKDREEEERILREKLRQEWVEKQQKLKNEEVDLVFSYWDGSGHRRSLRIKKRMTVQMFLTKALDIVRRENAFNELKSASVDQLIFVKDDVILPHHYSFYDFIVTRARGRTGLLFTFTESIKMPTAIIEVPATATTTTGMSTVDAPPPPPPNDNQLPGQISHAGKICLRSWYERNKHIFPACRWEPYDPEKRWSTHEPPKNRFCTK